jgi:hypothetical protein
MKKIFFGIIAVFCLVVGSGVATVEAAHFDHDEAVNIVCGNGGWWTDPSSGKQIHFSVGDIRDKGNTNPMGSSKIFLGSKGAPFIMNVTYYPDQGTYYAQILMGSSWGNDATWKTFMSCAYRN